VLAISKDNQVLFYNPQFAYLFRTAEDSGEKRISDLIRSPDVVGAYGKALSSGQIVRAEVQEVVGADKQPRIFQLSVAPLIKKHNQEIYAGIGIFHDITELKRVEQIRIDFVGNVSHELRTPLTTVNGYMQTLRADFLAKRLDQAGEFIDIVAKNVARMRDLVEDLLDLSSLESGKELLLEKIVLRELTEGVARQVNLAKHKVSFTYAIDLITADGKRLEQVLRNLLENAVRYVPPGGSIEVVWRQGAGGFDELSVKDDGPGIEPRHQLRLFERFYRVDESRTRSDGGTGIGLALVKHIVQAHGGQILLRSEVGRGAEFICRFPRP
jgi:two-component system, OmpR family, phosphate regulon sensor histidine kinase PhoR